MSSFFLQLYYKIKHYKWFSISALLILAGLLALLASQLKLEEDITQLIPVSEKSNLTNRVLQQVNFADKIIVYVENQATGNTDDLTQYASQLIDSLELHCSQYVKTIQGRVGDETVLETLDFVYENLPLFLEEKDYETIDLQLARDSIAQRMASNYKTLISPSGIVAKNTILKDPIGLSFLGLKQLQQLNIGDDFKLYNNFLVSKDEQSLLLFITPQLVANETDQNALFVEKLYQFNTQLNQEFTEKVSSEYYGTTVVAVANAQQIKWDIQLTISIAMSILLIILIFFYRRLTIPLILFTPTVLGGLTGLSVLYLLKSNTSAISLGIGSVLLGITLDYSLHILTHYRNNPKIKELYEDVTLPVLTSSLTTAFAFLCLLFLKSEALRDLGIFAAASVIGAAIFALILIPQLYRVPTTKQQIATTFIDKIAGFSFAKSKLLIAGFMVMLLGAFFTYDQVYFNQDLSSMNFQTAALKATEKKLDKLINQASRSIYVVAYGETTEEALIHHDSIFQSLSQLKKQEAILNFSSTGSVVLSAAAQQQRIDRWNAFWQNGRRAKIEKDLIETGNELGFKPSSFKRFYTLLDNDFIPIKTEDYLDMAGLPMEEYISTRNGFTTIASLVKVDKANADELVQYFADTPQTVVIDRKHINETFLGNLKNDFDRLIRYSFLVVFLLLLLFFRRIELALITIIPIMLTWWLTIGIMGLVGLEFNVFNIIISTFIFGLGIDYSIFISNGLIKKYKYGTDTLPTYRAAIILSVITTILGVGALIFAQHPALKSIAIISLIGILSAMFIAFTIQPLLFRFAISGRADKGLAPLRLRTSIHGFFLFAYYGIGGMLLSLFSVTILPLVPIAKKKKMTWLHRVMAKTVTSVLYGNPFVKKEVQNSYEEDFDPPAIIISNHASALDTLTMGMVTHKLIYLVNDWVYKSPIFGLLARVAGFYPVSSGVDNSLEHLEEKIRQGYSLVVFPEGKRSLTNKIGRFHKGAFFLAERLKMDILPFYLHGNSEVLPKRDRVIYDGSLTVKIGKRIPYNDSTFGTTYKERQKKISAYYKAEFQQLRTEIEDADYFKDILLSNYIYKGDSFYQVIKTTFQQCKERYQSVSDVMPFKTKIWHIADDYGQLDILLVARSLDRRIVTYIANEEQRIIATNCYTTTQRKTVYVAKIEDLTSHRGEVLLISATLPTLPELLLKQMPQFNKIIMVKNAHLSEQIKAIGYFVSSKKAGVICFERSEN